MRRRPPPEDIQLLSTSFLDLLCCGLCSVVLLWVLTGSGRKAPPDEPFGFVQVGQNGVWHWASAEVSPDDGKTWPYKLTNERSPIRQPRRDDSAAVKTKLGLTIAAHKGGDKNDEFSGLLILAADRRTAKLRVRVTFSACGIKGGIHIIRVTGQSGPRPIEDAFLYTEKEALDEALNADSATRDKYGKSVRVNIPGAISQQSKTSLTFDVTGGLITYKAPDAND